MAIESGNSQAEGQYQQEVVGPRGESLSATGGDQGIRGLTQSDGQATGDFDKPAGFGPGTPHKDELVGKESTGFFRRTWGKVVNVFTAPVDKPQMSRTDQFELVGYRPSNVPNLDDIVRKSLLDAHGVFPKELETPISEERSAQLAAVSRSIVTYGREELGVDLSQRVPPESDIHFYPDQASFDQAMAVNDLANHPNVAAHTLHSGEIIIRDTEKPEEILNLVGHEELHSAAPARIYMKKATTRKGSDLTIGRGGFTAPYTGAFYAVEEGLVEMTNQDIERRQWSDTPELSHATGRGLRHGQFIILTDEMLHQVAAAEGVSYKDVFRGFQQGLFKGDRTVFRAVRDVLGTEGVRALAHHQEADKIGNLSFVRDIAERAGLPGAAERIGAYARGEEITFMGDKKSLGYTVIGKRIEPDTTFQE
jgi:hypothetical protein